MHKGTAFVAHTQIATRFPASGDRQERGLLSVLYSGFIRLVRLDR